MTQASANPASDLIVPEGSGGARLDHFLRDALHLSRSRLSRIFQAGGVTVDGRPAKKGQPVLPGQRVALASPPAPVAVEPNPAMPLRLLHLDADLIAVDKPAGVASHPLKPQERGTVANALVARFPECEQASKDPREGGLCHRLDIGTSGVLLAARSRAVWERVRTCFARQEVDKRYWALVTGPLPENGEIDLPLRHRPGHPDRVEPSAPGDPAARDARSSFQVLGRAGEYALVEVRIYTGVLHQVRAHLAALGCPVVGDPLYGGRDPSELGRFFLHARSIELAHPSQGSSLRVESPLPPQLADFLRGKGLSPGPIPRSP